MLLFIIAFQIFLPEVPYAKQSFKSKAPPQNATYLRVDPIGYYNTAGGYELIMIRAMIPDGDVDSTYQGVVYLHAIESNPNSSVTFIPTETFIPADSALVDSGEVFVLVMDSEPETLGIYVTDAAGVLKSSLPVAFFVDSATTTNIPYKAKIEGADTINSSNFSFMQEILYISVIDSNGMVDTSICDFIGDTTKVKVKIIDDPDSSALLFNPFDGTSGPETKVPLVKGRGWLFFYDFTNTSETITLVAEDISVADAFGNDTFKIYVTVEEKATKLFPMSMSGAYGTVNVNKIYYLMAMLDGPDPSNSGTQVRLRARDISGSPSISITPPDFTTLQGGVYSFKVHNTEIDSFAFLFPESQGSPYLYPYLPVFMTGFKDTGQAVIIKGKIPTMIPVNDTFYTECFAMDMFENIDTTYQGWMVTNASDYYGTWSINFVDTLGATSTVFEIEDGKASFGFYDTEVETISIEYRDAEGQEPFFTYLGNNLLDNLEVWVTPQGLSATKWHLSEHFDITTPGHPIYVTVAAVDDSGYIDPLFPGKAYFNVTGDAIVIPESLYLDNGVGIVEVHDTTYETVFLGVSGGVLINDEDTLMFIPPDSGAYIMTEYFGEIWVNDTAELTGWILTPEYYIAENYNGYVEVYIHDDIRDTNSVYLLGIVNLDSVPVTNGTFSVMFSDSEPEYISVGIMDVKGELRPSGSEGLFYCELDKYLIGPHKEGLSDTAIVVLKDVYNDTIKINSEIYEDTFNFNVSEIGGSSPGSVVFTSPNPAGFQNGVSYCTFYDTESETLEVYVDPRNYDLFRNSGLIERAFYSGIEEFDRAFAVYAQSIQVGVLSLNCSIPVDGNVEITLFDIVGRKIYSKEVNLKKGVYRFTRDKLPSGIYYINVRYKGRFDSKKVVLFR